ncbi:hypothetical protein ACS0TY_020219 [Phlomoides rotata]
MVVQWCFAGMPSIEKDVDVGEAYAAYCGVRLAKEKGVQRLVLETDSQILFYALSSPKPNYSSFGDVVGEILALRDSFDVFRVSGFVGRVIVLLIV